MMGGHLVKQASLSWSYAVAWFLSVNLLQTLGRQGETSSRSLIISMVEMWVILINPVLLLITRSKLQRFSANNLMIEEISEQRFVYSGCTLNRCMLYFYLFVFLVRCIPVTGAQKL